MVLNLRGFANPTNVILLQNEFLRSIARDPDLGHHFKFHQVLNRLPPIPEDVILQLKKDFING
jgi:hypothetical protein